MGTETEDIGAFDIDLWHWLAGGAVEHVAGTQANAANEDARGTQDTMLEERNTELHLHVGTGTWEGPGTYTDGYLDAGRSAERCRVASYRGTSSTHRR